MASPKRIIADLKTFARGYTRSRVGLFFSLAFPIILILLFGAIFSGGSSGPVQVYLQNNDGSGQASSEFIQTLNGTSTGLHITLVDSSQNFAQYLLAHSTSYGIVIPSG